jgi:hypothetical protein
LYRYRKHLVEELKDETLHEELRTAYEPSDTLRQLARSPSYLSPVAKQFLLQPVAANKTGKLWMRFKVRSAAILEKKRSIKWSSTMPIV